uniref:Uncharacterized protein n=1 Tax=Glossina pallidipes TaxID=7398 RepID=A0A1B0A496_GLOPL
MSLTGSLLAYDNNNASIITAAATSATTTTTKQPNKQTKRSSILRYSQYDKTPVSGSCSLISWKIEPVTELNLQIVLSGVVFILLPFFFTSAVFKARIDVSLK